MEKKKKIEIFICYVDDGIVLPNIPKVLTNMLDHFEKQFEIRLMPENRFVGLDITRDRTNRIIYLSQTKYTQQNAREI